MSKPKVLIITYYWPPSGGAGVQRWLKFAKYLPELGFETHIYTPYNPEAPARDESLLKDVNPNLTVIRKPIFEPYGFYKKFTGKKGNVNAGFLSEDQNSREKLSEKVSVWIRGNFFIPDARVLWVKPSIRFLSHYLKEHNINTIISTGPPHSMHLIALALKKKMNLRWIADFRDPWTNIDFYAHLRLSHWADQKHHRLEAEVLQTADEVIVVGNTMKHEFQPLRKQDIHVITNGYDDDDFKSHRAEKGDAAAFNILHLGSINADRNHGVFWEALQQLMNENRPFKEALRLTFIGKNDYSVKSAVAQYHLESITHFETYIPHNQVAERMAVADLLYLPLNNTPNAKGIVSGKLFEYLACQLPILSIGHPDGDAAHILTETQAGITCDFEDVEAVKEAIIYYFKQKQAGLCISSKGIEAYSRLNLTRKLAELLG